MPTIGITGGVATGKSTVAQLFGELGACVLSADDAAREVTAPGTPALEEISAEFGEDLILADGSLDRRKLGRIVFKDARARRRLEDITHPRIRRLLREMIEQARTIDPTRVIAVEVPLLYEAGMEDWFDSVVVVSASRRTQIKRLAAKGYDAEDAERRIDAQIPLAVKAARADYLVENDGDREGLSRTVQSVLKKIVESG